MHLIHDLDNIKLWSQGKIGFKDHVFQERNKLSPKNIMKLTRAPYPITQNIIPTLENSS